MSNQQKLNRPPIITPAEITEKLTHLHSVLASEEKTGILFAAEGSLRWLTGVRQQITDIAPDAPAPISALVLVSGKETEITFITSPYEMPRIKDELPPQFKGVAKVKIKFALEIPKIAPSVVLPSAKNHGVIQGKIVRPLIGGLTGNQYKKYAWVAAMTSRVVAETAHEIKIGMNGAEVRSLIIRNLAEHGVETNMILIALKGQENHLHPLYGEQYTIQKGAVLKLVSAGRFGEVIVSETQMVKFGALTSAENAAFRALQQAAVEYADLYRVNANEHAIFVQCGERFKKIEKEYGLKGFAKSAYLHHLGGPTSPLGNRDYTLNEKSKAKCFVGESFAINPVECLCGTKVELQGIVTASAPLILDIASLVSPKILSCATVTASGGTVGTLPNFIIR